jgi:predicted CoA-binding protein
MVVIFRRPDAVAAHIQQAVAKHAAAVWLPPGPGVARPKRRPGHTT